MVGRVFFVGGVRKGGSEGGREGCVCGMEGGREGGLCLCEGVREGGPWS